MKIFKGKMIEGKPSVIPSFMMWGGCIFLGVYRTSYMIPMHDEIIILLQFLGFDPIKD